MRYFNFVAAISLTVLYAIGKIPPSENYNLWLTSFIIPVALACNIILLLISLLLRKKSSLYYILTLLIGSNYLLSTIGLKHFFKNHPATNDAFSVLNYNTNWLGGHATTPSDFTSSDTSSLGLEKWMLTNTADIQCYQEFLNYNGSKDFDFVNRFNQRGYFTYFSFDSVHLYKSVVVGVLIASKFPIVHSGDVMSSENGFNRIAYADVKKKADTIRIINVHLESMGLKKYHPAYTTGFATKKENTKIILSKLKTGVFDRSRQVKKLMEFIEASPYPVICVGDFNDLPYSYSYQFIKKKMKNAFEEVGSGFGFTYNGNTLRVLRIDNQFYTPQLQAIAFETQSNILFTDHFPLHGVFRIKSPHQDLP